MRGDRCLWRVRRMYFRSISIHSPHARGDTYKTLVQLSQRAISIHSPHARGDVMLHVWFAELQTISIHSPHARGDLCRASACSGAPVNFNPLPSCEGRPFACAREAANFAFQSTPLMRGETETTRSALTPDCNFNPLPSCEGRRAVHRFISPGCLISIHSPHARGDIS